ncbi:MAG: 4-alpha-glucanotransferase [Gammaproteobacteria bacterium]|nr:4-alpha-glucanotransferase [Gammaproteobacteria bacterium]
MSAPPAQPWIRRCAGVLLHLSSLPSGRLDTAADRFAQWLVAAGMHVWQMLPVGPADASRSPFSPTSGCAGNTGLLPPESTAASGFDDFCAANADWLEDWVLFCALSAEFPGRGWWQWPPALRDREPGALTAARRRHAPALAHERREQFRFAHAFAAFKRRVNALGLLLFGDTPLFLVHHSADVWAHRQLFEIADDGRVEAVLGVPPDAFSTTGQWWGYPAYRWSALAAEDWRWWRRRFQVQAQRFNLLRLDHFRGFAACWRIPADAPSALHGSWVPGPGRAALDTLTPVLGATRLVAEDLGVITEDVTALRRALGIPGMRVLQFAFDGGEANPHLPIAHAADTVCYTGTHDNDTTLGWWQGLDETRRRRVREYFGCEDPPMPAALIETAFAGVAPLSIVPLQDLLGLGSQARMNHPGVASGNWRWRFDWSQLPVELAPRLAADLAGHGRVAAAGAAS